MLLHLLLEGHRHAVFDRAVRIYRAAIFCYNVGRIVAAPGPILMGYLIGAVDKVSYAGALMGAFYILAFIFIPLLPETNKTELE